MWQSRISGEFYKVLSDFRELNANLFDIIKTEFDPKINPFNNKRRSRPEIEIEIPHENLRAAYDKGKNIWKA